MKKIIRINLPIFFITAIEIYPYYHIIILYIISYINLKSYFKIIGQYEVWLNHLAFMRLTLNRLVTFCNCKHAKRSRKGNTTQKKNLCNNFCSWNAAKLFQKPREFENEFYERRLVSMLSILVNINAVHWQYLTTIIFQ